nr:transposase (putative), gypsy type [Tanacetum cinerariifolium]
MPTGKIGVYTRFFEYANFQLPISTFLVNMLKHYRIHISQLSVIGAAKVSHFEILCRVHGFEPTVGLFRCFYVNSKNKGWMSFSKRQGTDAVCYTKPLDSLKGWNDYFFWIDAFACPALFLWHTGKSVSRDVIPKSSEFIPEHYVTLVAYPAPFHKYPEPFLCIIRMSRNYTLDENTYSQFLRNDDEEMDLLSFIRTVDPTKVRISERQRDEDEPMLLETTIRRVVPLLPVAPDRSSGELKASVDKLFDEGGSGEQTEQGDSASGGRDVGIDVVAYTIIEDVAPAQLKRQKKRKTKVANVGEPSHPAKKLRDDYGASGGPTVGGKSQSSIQRLLAGAVQNAKVRGRITPTLPFFSSFVSTTPEREGGDHTELLAGANLRAIGSPTSMPIITSATTTTPTVDHAAIAKEKLVGSSVFGVDSPSAGGSHPIPGGFSNCTGSDFLIGGIRTVIDPDSNLQKVYVPQWNVTNGFCLDDGGVCCEMVDEFAPLKFFTSVRGMKHEQLFTEFNVGAARQMSLSAEIRMRVEYNIREGRRLNSIVEEKTEKSGLDVKVADLAASVKVREQEVADLDDVVTSVKLQNDNLVHKLETSSAGLQEQVTAYDNCLSQLKKFQDDRMREMNDKFDKLDTDLVKMAFHLEERFYLHLLTTIFGRRWLLTHGLKLAISKCLNSTEYLSTLGAAIGKAVKKGMQDGLSAGITHDAEGRVLTDVVAYNPSAKTGYLAALQRLQSVNFSLIAELKSNKDASIDTIMNLLRLKDSLAEKLGLTKSQPHVDQLMVPIHHSPDQHFIGASALSLSLDVSSSRV